jgi:hypothetical protein
MEQPEPSRPAPVPDGVRRRLDEVFGEVLPEITRDEAGDLVDERPAAQGAQGDEWLRVNRPPHHDDRG